MTLEKSREKKQAKMCVTIVESYRRSHFPYWEGTDDAREDAATLVVSATGPPICAGGSAEHTALYSAHVKICDSRSRSAVSAPLFI